MSNSAKIHFEISERKFLLRTFDVIFVLVGLYCIDFILDFDYFSFSLPNLDWTLVLVLYMIVFGAIFEMYNLQVASNYFQILRSIVLTTSSTVFFYLLTPYFSPQLPQNRIQLLIFYAVFFVSLYLWRMLYVHFLASKRFAHNVVLICDGSQVQELVTALEQVDPHYKIVGYVNSDSGDSSHLGLTAIKSEDLTAYVNDNGIFEVVVASQNTKGITTDLYRQLLALLQDGKNIKEYTHVYEEKTQRIPVQFIERDFYRFFPFSRSNRNRLYLAMVRLTEIIFSVFGLILTALVWMPLIALGNLFFNKGSLFYTQERVGKDGVIFKIYKFRTMLDCKEKSKACFAKKNDTRVTPFAKFLRKTRIDEFPQFINILKGDMALIGPRPEVPEFVEQISKMMPFYETRHIVRPGLSGWAQVNFSYGESLQDSLIKLQYDLYYIKHRSVILDLSIGFKTISTVLFCRGQ